MKKYLAYALTLTIVFAQAIPALAMPVSSSINQEAPTEGTIPKAMSGKIVEENKDSIKVSSYSGEDEIILNITPETYIIDSVTGKPTTLAERTDDDVVIYYGPAETKSMPPQSNAVAILCSIPQDYKVPHYAKVESVEKEKDQIVVLVDDKSLLVTITDDVKISPFDTKEVVTIDNIDVGTELLLWYDAVALSFPGRTSATQVVILGDQAETIKAPIEAPSFTVVEADLSKGGTSDEMPKGATVTTNGKLPELKGEGAGIAVANTEIKSIFSHGMDMAGEDLKENETGKVTFSYETIVTDGYTSIVIHTVVSTGNTEGDTVDTIVLDNSGDMVLTLIDVLGPNAYKVANKVISEEIKNAEEGMYNTGENAFAGITSEPDFYIDSDMNVVIVFGKYTIAPGSTGTPMFEIPLENLTNYVLSTSKTYVKGEVIMVPLRDVSEALGYKIGWDAKTGIVSVYDDSETHTLKVGTVKYDNKELEVAPELKDGVTYVPISFFEVILGDCYLASEGTIIFTSVK